MAGAGRAIAGVAVVVAAALTLFLALRGNGNHPPAAAGAGLAGAGANPASGQAAPVSQADPLSGAAASYVTGRSGSVLAAVYDIATGQSWRLGHGPAQAEASVVKLDILETLLARQGGATLSPGDQSLSQSMIEESDNDAATSLWDEAGGATGIGAYNDSAGLTGTTPSACVTCTGFAWPGWGLTTTVPQDQLTLLKQLIEPGSRPLLSGAQRSYVLSLMENVASGQRWGVSGEHQLADQQRRLGFRRRPRLPDRRLHHRQPDRAVRHRHDRRPVGARLGRDALDRAASPAPMRAPRRGCWIV
jgi:hypothetical protein